MQITQIVVLVLGGLFAYFKFFRGRTFATRCTIEADGVLSDLDPVACLHTEVRIKNTGQSAFWLRGYDHQYVLVRGLGPSRLNPETDEGVARWAQPEFAASRRLFGEDQQASDWLLEPSEEVTRSVLVPVPNADWCYRIDTHLNLRRRGAIMGRLHSREWNDQRIVLPGKEPTDAAA